MSSSMSKREIPIDESPGTVGSVLSMIDKQLAWNKGQATWNAMGNTWGAQLPESWPGFGNFQQALRWKRRIV